MSIEDVTPVTLKSRLLEGGTRHLYPINDTVVVEREPATRAFGLIIGVSTDNTFDIQLSKVLSVASRVKVATRNGPLKVGDRILSVRVVNKRNDSIDARTDDNNSISFLNSEHVLAVVDDENIWPAQDLLLISAQPDRRMVGQLEILGSSNLEMHSSEIISIGPNVDCGAEPGLFAVHLRINGCALDSHEIRRRFGHNLKLIRQKSLHAISTAPIVDDPTLENNPDYVPNQLPKGLQ